jgi:hypothetical protein
VEGLKLELGEQPAVRIRDAGGGLLITDALHVFSTERYNDGKANQTGRAGTDGRNCAAAGHDGTTLKTASVRRE